MEGWKRLRVREREEKDRKGGIMVEGKNGRKGENGKRSERK